MPFRSVSWFASQAARVLLSHIGSSVLVGAVCVCVPGLDSLPKAIVRQEATQQPGTRRHRPSHSLSSITDAIVGLSSVPSPDRTCVAMGRLHVSVGGWVGW